MARGRFVNQNIALDAEFNAMSLEAQLMYMRTIPHLDRDGLVLGNPTALWAKVAPLLEQLLPQMSSIIGEWVDAGLVIRYTSKMGDVLYFTGFTKNQVGLRYDREAESPYPPPPGFIRTPAGLQPIDESSDDDHGDGYTPPPTDDDDTDSAETTRIDSADDEQALRTESGPSPDELRHESGPSPEVLPLKLSKVKEREDARAHVREYAKPRTGSGADPSPPPAETYFGLPDPRVQWRQQQEPEQARQANQLGIDMPAFTELTNAVLDGCRLRQMADDPNDRFTLRDAQDAALFFVRQGRATVEQIETVFEDWDACNRWKWKNSERREYPTFKQIKQHLSQMEPATDEPSVIYVTPPRI